VEGAADGMTGDVRADKRIKIDRQCEHVAMAIL
jgi:hypothetical protein